MCSHMTGKIIIIIIIIIIVVVWALVSLVNQTRLRWHLDWV